MAVGCKEAPSLWLLLGLPLPLPDPLALRVAAEVPLGACCLVGVREGSAVALALALAQAVGRTVALPVAGRERMAEGLGEAVLRLLGLAPEAGEGVWDREGLLLVLGVGAGVREVEGLLPPAVGVSGGLGEAVLAGAETVACAEAVGGAGLEEAVPVPHPCCCPQGVGVLGPV